MYKFQMTNISTAKKTFSIFPKLDKSRRWKPKRNLTNTTFSMQINAFHRFIRWWSHVNDVKLSPNLFNIYLNIFWFDSVPTKKGRKGRKKVSKISNLFRYELTIQLGISKSIFIYQNEKRKKNGNSNRMVIEITRNSQNWTNLMYWN